MSTALINLHTPETPWSFRDLPIIVGKDILEVLSNAMYVDPLAIYREYIQNAADAIDEARRTSVLSPKETGTVEIEIDIEKRTVTIHDNGTGISAAEFESRLTSFGASVKRGTNSRGLVGARWRRYERPLRQDQRGRSVSQNVGGKKRIRFRIALSCTECTEKRGSIGNR